MLELHTINVAHTHQGCTYSKLVVCQIKNAERRGEAEGVWELLEQVISDQQSSQLWHTTHGIWQQGELHRGRERMSGPDDRALDTFLCGTGPLLPPALRQQHASIGSGLLCTTCPPFLPLYCSCYGFEASARLPKQRDGHA